MFLEIFISLGLGIGTLLGYSFGLRKLSMGCCCRRITRLKKK